MIFPRLLLLDLSSNQLTGPLPEEWGSNGAWPELKQLAMGSNRLTGTIPDSWVVDYVRPRLCNLSDKAFIVESYCYPCTNHRVKSPMHGPSNTS